MKNKILVHVCCAPCFAALYFLFREKKFNVFGFWYNFNIHPFMEYQKRLKTLKNFADEENIQVIYKDEYDLEKFLRKAAFRENSRCQMCYYERLKYTAIVAKKGNFDYFTTTLLYSKFQKHKEIIEIAESLSKEYGIKFYYEDFREYWKEGIIISKEQNMYRQQYCGCIYSEKERYLGKDTNF